MNSSPSLSGLILMSRFAQHASHSGDVMVDWILTTPCTCSTFTHMICAHSPGVCYMPLPAGLLWIIHDQLHVVVFFPTHRLTAAYQLCIIILTSFYRFSFFLLFHVSPTSLCTSALTGILSQQGMWVRHPLKRLLFLIKLLQQCSQVSICTEYVLWRAQTNSPLSSSLIQPSVLMGKSLPGPQLYTYSAYKLVVGLNHCYSNLIFLYLIDFFYSLFHQPL